MHEFLLTLAQTTTAPAKQPSTPWQMWVGILVMVAVFYFVLLRGNPNSRKKRSQMLDALKKNDRVMTIGGIVGTVVTVKDREIVIKVDETTNTKMTFVKDAIRTVVQDDTDLNVQER